MKLEIEHQDGTTIMRIASESLDAGNVEAFRQQFKLHLNEAPKVLIDMSKLNFVDSSGLGSILSCLKAVRQSQGDLKLCALSRPVRALFEMMSMHKVFSIYGTRDEALRAF